MRMSVVVGEGKGEGEDWRWVSDRAPGIIVVAHVCCGCGGGGVGGGVNAVTVDGSVRMAEDIHDGGDMAYDMDCVREGPEGAPGVSRGSDLTQFSEKVGRSCSRGAIRL